MTLGDSVYERLLQQRIIVLGQRSTTRSPTASWRSCCCLFAEDPQADITLTSTRRAARSPRHGDLRHDAVHRVRRSHLRDGLAASMGQFLLSAGTKGKRYARRTLRS